MKDLETFYMEKRTGEVATAGSSIVAYENWLETREQNILDEIERYNEIDCRSTKGLRDWLIEVRPDGATWFVHEDAPAPPEDLIDADRQAAS